jgi:hypothetical protein
MNLLFTAAVFFFLREVIITILPKFPAAGSFGERRFK